MGGHTSRPRCARSSSPTCTSAGPRRQRPAAPRRPARAAAGGARRRRPARDPRRRPRAAGGRAPRRDGHRARRSSTTIGSALGTDKELVVARRQPRSRDRGGLDRRPPAERAVRLPRPRAALRARRGRPARPAAGRGRAARPPAARLSRASGSATTSTRSTATTPTCTRRCRPSSAWPAGRWPATSPSCPSTHATPDDYEAVLSPLYAWLHALTQRADHTVVSVGGSASASTYAKLTAKDRHKRPRTLALEHRLPRRGRRAQPRRPRPARVEPVALRAAPRLPARHQQVIARLDIDAAARHLGPLAPLRPVARGRPGGVDRGQRHADPQHRLVGLPAALPHARSPTARPTGPAPPCSSTTTARRGSSACSANAATPSSGRDRPGVKQVACTVTPSPTSSASVARGVDLVLDQREAARLADLERRAVDPQRRPRPRRRPTRRPPRTGPE